MDKCPPELHAYICQLTCIDDGQTIRSINQTSRYFYHVSKPYLYRNLYISGPKQIHAISGLLETSSKAYLRHIRHLFISDAACATENHGPLLTAVPETHTLILRIISSAAPTLESLTLIAYSPQQSTSLIARLFRISFPRLRNLTISGFYPFPTSAGKFPRLERLHLNGNRNPHGLLQMSILENTCPSLEFLTVSGLGSAASFVMEIKEAMGNRGTEIEDPVLLFPAKFPARLRQVILQAGPKVVREGIDLLKDRLMMKSLEGLKMETNQTNGVPQVIVLDRSPEPTIVYDTIKQEWFENIVTFTSQDY